MHIEFNNYKMFNRQIRFKINDNYFSDYRMPRIFSLYLTSFAYLNFWILVFSLLIFLLRYIMNRKQARRTKYENLFLKTDWKSWILYPSFWWGHLWRMRTGLFRSSWEPRTQNTCSCHQSQALTICQINRNF